MGCEGVGNCECHFDVIDLCCYWSVNQRSRVTQTISRRLPVGGIVRCRRIVARQGVPDGPSNKVATRMKTTDGPCCNARNGPCPVCLGLLNGALPVFASNKGRPWVTCLANTARTQAVAGRTNTSEQVGQRVPC